MSTASPLLVLARHELKTLSRERTFMLLLGIFLAVTFFSVFIGWSTRATTFAIYDATVAVLHAAHVTVIPGNPLLGVSSLGVFNNLIIYILLVGALLAIVIGHRSFIRERRSGVIPLMFVRPLSKTTYVAGKLFGIMLALGGIILATFLVSAGSAILIPALHLSGAEFVRLAAFYTVSFVYLTFFAALGFVCAVWFSSESIALFAPIMLWIAFVFILPELATGQNPVSLLNPISLAKATPNPSVFFATMRTILAPISLGQYYTETTLMLLKAGPSAALSLSQGLAQVWSALFGLLAYAGALSVVCVLAVRSYASSSDPLL